MTAENLPDPLVPLEVDLTCYKSMPLVIEKLRNSSFNIHMSDAAWRAGLNLWASAWHQIPAGSLPDDDRELCHLADLGRNLLCFAKIKKNALNGFIKCKDNRFYHPYLCSLVMEAWEKRQEHLERRGSARERKRQQREREAGKRKIVTGDDKGSHKGGHASVTQDKKNVTGDNALKGREVQERKKEGTVTRDMTAAEIEKTFEDWWRKITHKIGKGAARRAFKTALKKTDIETLTRKSQTYYAKMKREEKDRHFWLHPATWLNGEHWSDGEKATLVPSSNSERPTFTELDDTRPGSDGLTERARAMRRWVTGEERTGAIQ